MFGCYPPRCEGECIHLLEVVVAGDVLLRDPKLGHRDERRQRLGPLDGDVLDWHPCQIDAQLDLDVEFIRAVPQFGYQRRAESMSEFFDFNVYYIKSRTQAKRYKLFSYLSQAIGQATAVRDYRAHQSRFGFSAQINKGRVF